MAFRVPSATAADIYVKWDVVGTANGSSWENAYTSIAAAYATATGGDVLIISGGVDGHTYDEPLDITQGVTFQGASESGHAGTVIWAGQKKIRNTSGTITLRNMELTAIDDTEALYFYYGSTSNFEDITLFGVRTVSKYALYIAGGTATFTRCRFADTNQSAWNFSRLAWTSFAASTFTFNNCIFDFGAGKIIVGTPGSNWTFNNCLFAGSSTAADVAMLQIGNDPTISVTFNNSSFLGSFPVRSYPNSTGVICNNCYWHSSALPRVASFDSAEVATINNSIDHVLPYLVDARNSLMGSAVLRIDDMGKTDEAKATAEILNPEAVVTLYTNGHGDVKPPIFQQVWDWRYLVDNGNEVAAHGSTHSDNSNMDALTISASGTNPGLTITGIRDGDSVTWSGTLSITINDVTRNYDLTDPSINTIFGLIIAINGTTIGDGVVSVLRAHPQLNWNMKSTVLDDVVSLDISADRTLVMNESAYVRFEIRENIEDIETYIRTGSDRNGLNPSGAGMAASGTIAATYTVHSYATAYARGSSLVYTEVANDPDIWGASLASGHNGGRNLYRIGSASFDLYNFPLVIAKPDNAVFAMVASPAVTSSIISLLRHGVMQYQGTTAALKELCVGFGGCDRTFSEVLEMIRTSGDWTIADNKATFTGNIRDYFSQGDFRLTAKSPLIDAGLATGMTIDILGNPIYGIPDIGPYEYQSPYTLGSDPIDITGAIRIYADGKYRYTTVASGGAQADLVITPSGGFGVGDYSEWMDVTINEWNTSGDYFRKWTESGSMPVGAVTIHTVGGLQPGEFYQVAVDGGELAVVVADTTGRISFTYTNPFPDQTIQLTVVSLPALDDVDNDGLPGVWETANGLDPADDGTINPDNGRLGDPDNDGYTNAEEYRAGTDPQLMSSYPEGANGVNYVLFRDRFDDSQYTDRWYLGAADFGAVLGLSESGTELNTTLDRPLTACVTSRLQTFAVMTIDNMVFHAVIKPSTAGTVAVGLFDSADLNNRLKVEIDGDTAPYLTIRSWDGGVPTAVAAAVPTDYQGAQIDVRVMKAGNVFTVVVNNVVQGNVVNNGLNGVTVRAYLDMQSCDADGGGVDVNDDLIELLLDRDGDGLPDTLEDANSDGIVDADEGDPLVGDTDGDSVMDGFDNCVVHLNAVQRDTNGDGYGNFCDGDLNGDGFVNSLDLGLFKAQILAVSPDPDMDINGDGFVNSQDIGLFKDLFFQSPGPSALAP